MKAIGSAGFLIAGIAIAYAQADIAPTGTLRAAYLATNPAQAIRDAHTGEVRGVSFDLARELAKQIGKPLDFKPIASPPVVIDAVRSGQADIGFVAYEATRLGTVEFSQTYMLVQQSFLVLGDSPIHAVADIDRIGQKVSGTYNPELIAKALVSREIDALGANRQRLTTLMKSVPGSRLLPDNFFNVPQNIVVPMDKPEILASINAFIDDLRTSGFLGDAVARSVVVGIEAAPKSLGSQHGCPG